MLGGLTNFVTKVFGTKSQRDIKKILPRVDEINQAYVKLKNISNDQLREKSRLLKKRIADGLKEFEQQAEALKKQVADQPDMDLNEKEAIYNQVDKITKESDEALEKILDELLPEAFAIMRETARRFKENASLEVTVTETDVNFAATRSYVAIEGQNAVWQNTWPVRGQATTWNMVHYDVQLIGGVVLHSGKIAEMATGEGKTLVATLPAFLNGLSGKGVHIVTVNDYLATRDSEWMAPLFEFHGMRVDCIDKYEPHSDGRKNAYLADVTYGTNNEFGFDYLRDNMAHSPDDRVQRKLHFSMVDEIDSILIDDARTPLIISGPIPQKTGNQQEFDTLKPRVTRLVEAQKKLVNEYLNTARKLLKEGKTKEAAEPLFRAYRGLPKSKPLIKLLSEMGAKGLLQKTENYYLQDNAKMMPEADKPLYFTIDEKQNSIELTDNGFEFLSGLGEDPKFFIMPDISVELNAIDKNPALTDQEKFKEKERISQEYTEKSHRIHTVNQLLKAYTLFEKDIEYIIEEGKIKIVDEQTGRVLDGRRYSDGLHQAIEAKENVKVEAATQTYATVTLQNYFRMYHKLAGMTGTAETEAGEFWEIYKLDVVVIPTNKPIARDDRQDKVYRTIKEKYNLAVDEIIELTKKGRPVLVGTTSVENSEILSRMLQMRKINHQVLNAKFHEKEAEVVANAGLPGTVTIATNMAGRGTDIKLHPESKKAGGLAIIGTERHESRRVDRQLRGRSGRQGDPGSTQFFVSLEDSLMRLFGSERIPKMMDKLGIKMAEGEVIQHSIITKSIENAQKKVEENNFGIRKRLLEYDDVMNYQREVIYKRRLNALEGERLELDIHTQLFDYCEELTMAYKPANDLEGLQMELLTNLGFQAKIEENKFVDAKESALTSTLFAQALNHYKAKNQMLAQQTYPVISQVFHDRGDQVKNIVVPFTDGFKRINVYVPLEKAVATEGKELVLSLEKFAALSIIDQAWMSHLREMDELRQSVQHASYEQKDPLLIYKFEALELFKQLIAKINQETVSFLFKAGIPAEETNQNSVREARGPRTRAPRTRELKQTSGSGGELSEEQKAARAAAEGVSQHRNTPTAPIKSQKIHGRNDKVSVRYQNGTVKRDVKFKTVENDILKNECVLIDE